MKWNKLNNLRWLIVLGLSCLWSEKTLGQTSAGAISGNETWSGEVRLTGDVTVGRGASLTILPGTRVVSGPGDDTGSGEHAELVEIVLSGGELRAVGEEDRLIEFTSEAEVESKGAWYGIRASTGTLDLSFASLDRAHVGLLVERAGEYTVENVDIASYDGGIIFEAAGRYTFRDIELRDSWASPRGVWTGVLLRSGNLNLDIDRMVIDQRRADSRSRGVYAGVSPDDFDLQMSNCTINTAGVAVGFDRFKGEARLEDCVISGHKGVEVTLDTRNNPAMLDISGSDIVDCGDSGVRVRTSSDPTGNATSELELSILDCLIAGNGGDGVSVAVGASARGTQRVHVALVGSTVESNEGSGVSVEYPGVWEEFFGNQIKFNGIGLSTDRGMGELLVGNDFELNNVHLRNLGSSPLLANGNYWGVATTAALEAGETSESLDVFAGPIEITDWATSSVLEPVEPPPSPIVWDRPEATVDEGGSYELKITIENAEGYEYEWFKDGEAVPGVSGPVFELTDAGLEDSGDYQVVVSNEAGSVTSETVRLTVLPEGGSSGDAHPADTDRDFRISINEVTRYGAAWKNGTVWEVGPNPIPIDYLTRAGALWKNGEAYVKDEGVGSAPLWWVNAPSGAGSRSVVGGSVNGDSVYVARSGTPAVLGVALLNQEGVRELKAPEGVSAWALDLGGSRWGPYLDGGSETVDLPSVKEAPLAVGSYDGRSFVVVRDGNRRPTAFRAEALWRDGALALRPTGPAGVAVVEVSTDLVNWEPVALSGVRDGDSVVVPTTGDAERFFRLRSLEGALAR